MMPDALRDRRRDHRHRDDRRGIGGPGSAAASEVVRWRRWRKLKGVAVVRLRNGRMRKAELHWYEAHGIGRKEIKRKRYVDWAAYDTAPCNDQVRRLR